MLLLLLLLWAYHTVSEIRLGFQAIDRNKNGYITEGDLKQVVHLLGQNMSDREITDMMRKADKNGKIGTNEVKQGRI